MKKISLGIDTSCYTTSLVVMDDSKTILYEDKLMLKVKEGTVGLRQSDAFFQHVKNLPTLYEKCSKEFDTSLINRVVVSDKPRNVTGSYMPVFLAGEQVASVISTSLQVPLHRISHQENHLYAVAYAYNLPESYLGMHISGGTSEMLYVKNILPLDIDIIGHTLDMSIGKLIDRIGVYMGFDFPCGHALDQLKSNDSYNLKLSVKDKDFNISGIENKLKQLYDKDKNPNKIANSLFIYISKLLIKVLDKALEEFPNEMIVMSGGVTANGTIRRLMKSHYNDQILFADVKYATDHSVGNAYYGIMV